MQLQIFFLNHFCQKATCSAVRIGSAAKSACRYVIMLMLTIELETLQYQTGFWNCPFSTALSYRLDCSNIFFRAGQLSISSSPEPLSPRTKGTMIRQEAENAKIYCHTWGLYKIFLEFIWLLLFAHLRKPPPPPPPSAWLLCNFLFFCKDKMFIGCLKLSENDTFDRKK